MYLTNTQEIRHELGEDLWLIIQKSALPIRKVKRLTSLVSDHFQRGSYKVMLADGSLYKLRRFQSQAQADKVKSLSESSDIAYFPRILDSHGTGLLIEWVNGKSINPDECPLDILIKAACIQGIIHNSSMLNNKNSLSGFDAHYWQNRSIEAIIYLIEKRVLSLSEGRKLFHLAELESSKNVKIGLTHGDYCLENMVLNGKNRLSIIDLENIAIAPLSYDLARTTYLWPMDVAQRHIYIDHYKKFRTVDEFMKNFSFWLILVLTESTIFHFKGCLDTVRKPLNTLKQVLQCRNKTEIFNLYGY